MSLRSSPARAPEAGRRIHPAWWVAVAAFLSLFGAAGFRAAPGALMVPLHDEFGWSMSAMSLAVSVNLVLYGLISPFAAALMDRFGLREVVSAALLLVALGAGGSVLMTASWQLLVFWGVLIGSGTGAMALVFAATISDRWFVKRRALVMGVLTAGQATGQLVLLPPVAALAENVGWRTASLVIAAVALAVVPVVWLVIRDHPEDRGVLPFGADPRTHVPRREQGGSATRRALEGLAYAVRHRSFWALAIAFAICGATTNGLIGIHFIPAAHDHGMAATAAAGLLAAVGVFDIVGTIASGWLTDIFDPRILLVAYYAFRGVSLLLLPLLLSDRVHPSMVVFVIIYGLDWVATVPPTAILCREIFGDRGTIVFGWVFAAHQVGAAAAAFGAGVIRDTFGTYTYAWLGGAAMCVIAAALCVVITPTRRRGRPGPRPPSTSPRTVRGSKGRKHPMPLVRIDLPEGTSPEHRQGIAEVVYDALVDVAGAPAKDEFVVINQHAPTNLVIDPHFMVDRTERALIIQITFNAGRSLDVKKALYRAIADGLHERIGQRTEDVMINLVEVPKENWSFGLGEAQLAD